MGDENQHWVPKFLIKHFADGGRVYCHDIHTDEVTKPPPKHAASEQGFNDFQVDGKLISFEDKFEKLETKTAPVIKRIIEQRSLAALSPVDRKHLANFVAAQSIRTKAFYEGMGEKPARGDFATTFRYMWHSSPVIARELARRHWALMVVDDDDVFYLGDNPVVLQRTQNPKDGRELGFDVEGIEVFLPLSPKCALYMACRKISSEIIGRYEAAMSLHRTIRSDVFLGAPGGGAELQVAQDTIRRTHPLYQAFTRGLPLTSERANIENLNYLQCSWSFRWVYSNRNDFAFARRVFRENPQYRNIPRTSVIEIGRIQVPAADI
jgi:hypothetical protein